MSTFFFSLGVFIFVVVIMAVGVIMGRPAIKGSCGGLNGKTECEICGDIGNCQAENK